MKKKEPKVPREVFDNIDAELNASTVVTEVVTASLICNALDIMLRDVDNRIRSVYKKYGLNVNNRNGKIQQGCEECAVLVRKRH